MTPYKPRRLRSKTPSVKIDKDNGNERLVERPNAGEGAGPSTLAVSVGTPPSASLRGGPAPASGPVVSTDGKTTWVDEPNKPALDPATVERCARWHDEQAANAAKRHGELNRYGDTADERDGWRSWKDAEDRHRSYAAALRALSPQAGGGADQPYPAKDGGTLGPWGRLTGEVFRLLVAAKGRNPIALQLLHHLHERICQLRYEINGETWPESRAVPPAPDFAATPSPAAVPDGWKLVPKEPTQAMLDACGPKPSRWDATPQSKSFREQCDQIRRDDYKTMLSTAPQAPVKADAAAKVVVLAGELCDAVDRAGEDIGGSRPVEIILAELGPAVDAARPAPGTSPVVAETPDEGGRK